MVDPTVVEFPDVVELAAPDNVALVVVFPDATVATGVPEVTEDVTELLCEPVVELFAEVVDEVFAVELVFVVEDVLLLVRTDVVVVLLLVRAVVVDLVVLAFVVAARAPNPIERSSCLL